MRAKRAVGSSKTNALPTPTFGSSKRYFAEEVENKADGTLRRVGLQGIVWKDCGNVGT